MFLITLLAASLFIATSKFNNTPISGHSPLAYPKEIYSLYNSTILPNIDGNIEFSDIQASVEWASAAIYDMYDNLENPRGKIFLQNDDSYLYIGLDMIDHEVEDPTTAWGAGVFFDLNHNGILDTNDRCITVTNEINETLHVDIYRGLSNEQWDLLATSTIGVEISTYNITVDMDYTKSFFEPTNDHRQYEFKIDLDTLNKSPGDLFGIGFEATNSYTSGSNSITWPYKNDISTSFRTTANYWGDIYLGENGVYTKYVIEDNFNIKDGAIGTNNGTFLASGDINGDGDLELIVSSNRTVSGDTNLIAIYDTVDGELSQIWNSWTSMHYSSLFLAQGIACYDFTGNGEDEIYMVSTEDLEVLRLKDWNDTSSDFDTLDLVFDCLNNTMGYIAIGDATNDGEANILIGDNDTAFAVLEYNTESTPFTLWTDYWYIPDNINGSAITKIHAVGIADTDHDIYDLNEILLLSQFSSDDSISSTGLQIFEIWVEDIYDNPTADPVYGYEDDLPANSHTNTFDSFGHTIIVDDVDNDGIHETIIVGKDYLKIFGHDTFNDTTIPLVLDINDEMHPSMGGGAGVFDIDGDTYNELIVGCNNGTTFVFQITDLNADDAIEDLVAITEWKGDLGTMPGKRGSIIGMDIDGDGADEAIISDQFGQIIVLGLGELPSFTITSPIASSTSYQDTILFEWETSNDTLPIVFYDIYINFILSLRIGGAQSGTVIPLGIGNNFVNIVCTDIRGKTDSDSLSVAYDARIPTIEITQPRNGYLTNQSSFTVYWEASDPQSDILTFEVYANGTLKGTTSNLQYSFSFDSEGTWNITIIADDGTGDRVKDMIYVIYASTPGGANQWLKDNLYTVVIPSAAGLLLLLILASILSVTVRKRGVNRGWQDAVKAVAYVTKSGLTVAYVQYAEDLLNDEQLFGGALTGIVSILGEITGEAEVAMKVQTMEYGGKHLLVCSGIFGNAILLVSEVKPILKDLLLKFMLEFELTYKFTLSQDMLNLNDYEAVSLVVESYFGVRNKNIRNGQETSLTEEAFDQDSNEITDTEESVIEFSEELPNNSDQPTEIFDETSSTEEREHGKPYESNHDSNNDYNEKNE